MMPDKKKTSRFALRTVLVALPGAQLLEKEPVFLFAARQIEEVLPEVKAQPLPFAPDWLSGLCAWRRQVLPVIDMASLYDLTYAADRHFYMVVRVILAAASKDAAQEDKLLLRCVLKVSDRISAGEASADCQPVAAERTGMNPAMIKGIFTHENRLLILPDLRPALCAPAAV